MIPTRNRPDRLRECLDALTRQSAGSGNFEILLGVDGPDSGESELAARILDDRVPYRVLSSADPRGPGATRNALLEHASGHTILFLNDDVVPTWDLVERHIDAHAHVGGAGRFEHGAMILGSAPWRVLEPDRVIDRLVRETSLIFFYDQMTGPRGRDPDLDWGFRHAWTLNLSVPRAAVRAVGGFDVSLDAPAYEDIELGFRLRERFDMPVLFRPGALVEHVHRYEPPDLLRREAVLGYQSHALAGASPACARAIFGHDPRGQGPVTLARAYLAGELKESERALRAWLDVAEKPAETLGTDPAVVDAVFALYRCARRALRHAGLVAAADGRPLDDALADVHPFDRLGA